MTDLNRQSSALTDRLIDLASSGRAATSQDDDRRVRDRVPYDAWVALVLVSAAGVRSRPMLLRATNLSLGGVSVVSRHMIHPGAEGALQFMRSDGTTALVGVRAQHCRYIGNLHHHTGLGFVPLTQQFSPSEFLDDRGRLLLLDPGLAENRRASPLPRSA